MGPNDGKTSRTFTEEIEVMGTQLIERVRDLLNEGNVRQLRIKTSNGALMLETPLTSGVIADGAGLHFTTVLGPGADASHDNHLHLDIKRRNNSDRLRQQGGPAIGNEPVFSPDKHFAQIDQNSPSIWPISLRQIFSEDGDLGKPGMVMISPVITTMNPAPADNRTSRTGTV